MKDYKDWIVWQRSMQLVEDIYSATKTFPVIEMHGLASQMQRAAVSIPSNIAEGHGRSTTKDKLHFYRISFGSARELETQIEIAKRLKYISPQKETALQNLLLEVLKLLSRMVFPKTI